MRGVPNDGIGFAMLGRVVPAEPPPSHMANLSLGTIVADGTDQLALVWERAHGVTLALPVRYLKRPRLRSDVLLDGKALTQLLGFPTKATMVIDTRERVVIDRTCGPLGEADAALLARIRQTIKRANDATLMEHYHDRLIA